MCESRFYFCEKCGNLAGMIHSTGVPMYCCGEKMIHLDPLTSDQGAEKHLPSVKKDGDRLKVDIGEIPHPMEKDHYISWVYLQTDRGGHRKCIATGDKPTVTFITCSETPIAVYAYCNRHGLWKTDIHSTKAL